MPSYRQSEVVAAQPEMRNSVMKITRNLLLFLLVAIMLGWSSCGGGSSSAGKGPNDLPSGSCSFNPGDNHCTMQHDNTTRQYLVHVPPKYVQNSSALIVALHPSQSSGAGFANTSGWSNYADLLPSPQPAVVYPDGLLTAGTSTEPPHPSWNNFFSCAIFPQPCPNDSDFIRQIILVIESNIHVNPKAVYVTGFSKGSVMAGRVAVDQSDLVAAIAQYEFPLGIASTPGGTPIPNASMPVAALYIDGDHSGLPNVCGWLSGSNFQSSVDQDMTYWTSPQNDNCSSFDTTGNFCTGAYDSQGFGIQTALTEKNASGCSGGTAVQIYKLLGGTHQYYCSNNSGCSPVVNFNNSVCDSTTPCNPNVNSATGTTLNDIIWKFFTLHPKP